MQKVIAPVKIESRSQAAIVCRNVNRRFVDDMFKEIDEKIMLPNGRYRYKLNKIERRELDEKARFTWRDIIVESNRL